MKRDIQVKFSSKQNMEKETKTNIVILQGLFVMLILNKGNYSSLLQNVDLIQLHIGLALPRLSKLKLDHS